MCTDSSRAQQLEYKIKITFLGKYTKFFIARINTVVWASSIAIKQEYLLRQGEHPSSKRNSLYFIPWTEKIR
jgi:hypothetical protein